MAERSDDGLSSDGFDGGSDPDGFEDELRARLERYGSALEGAASAPAPRPRHLVVVDGPVGGRRSGRGAGGRSGAGGSSAGSSGPGSGAGSHRLARVAAVLVVLGALAGVTWAAVRPSEPTTTSATEGGWSDDDVVRPEDRPSAFAALDGTWALPPGGSLRYVLDRPADGPTTFAGFRAMLADDASCLWFRHALEEPDLTAEARSTIAAMPGWPGHGDDDADGAERRQLDRLVSAALAGDAGTLREHLAQSCGGSGSGLGLPEVGAYWLVPGGEHPEASASPGAADLSGAAAAVDPTTLRGWDAVVDRLGAEVRVDGAIALGDGSYNIALTRRSLHLSLTIGTVAGPVTLPVAGAAFERGHEVLDGGVEVFVGPVADDDVTVAHVVGPGGASIALTFEMGPDRVEDAMGDITDLAVDLHLAAWPR
jgi:hypothetical protein